MRRLNTDDSQFLLDQMTPCLANPRLFDRIGEHEQQYAWRNARVQEAISRCLRDCPVLAECAAYGQATKGVGVYGGEYLGIHRARQMRKRGTAA